MSKIRKQSVEFTCGICFFRHPFPQKEAHYTYRFQVPDSDSYDVSWTNFTGDELENYNWNYVDHYICSRGEEEFSLCEVSSVSYIATYIIK